MVFQGGLAIGSAIWGLTAEHFGNSAALSGAAIGLVVGLIAALPYRLIAGEKLDLTPSLHWPEPVVAIELNLEEGPVLITIEYRIDPARSHDFAEAMHALSRVRRRDGAIRWSLWKDTALPNRYLETYVVESWAEHLRQHERMTVADLGEEARVRAFHIGDKPPLVSHLIYAHDTHGVR
ncbi:MFS transporter [Argonema galeatum]|uniref:MFS transporter n=1 Tax=Argonema galeatum TaxID=2942762 RepID=UPI0020138085|nr:MFS transporter [Argonema galeatum]MCL1462988.1 MFS transporter [Argonema galeatum A003/A1]